MAATIESERAHALSETASAEIHALEPAAVDAATADRRAIQLAGVGAGAGAATPPWLGSDRGTVTSVLGTIQRIAGNRAACELLGRHGAGNAAVAQRSADGSAPGGGTGRSPVLDVIGRGGGSTLDDATRTAMERRFGGDDFRDVRVHTGQSASRSAEAVGANAYTVGNEIVVRDGHLSEHTLAHELTHVQQQRAGPVEGTETGDGVRVSTPSDRFEQAAELTAQRVMAAAPSSGPPPVTDEAAGPGTDAAETHAIQRLAAPPGAAAAPPGATTVAPQSGRKPPGPGNDQVASFIRRWNTTQGERAASASRSDGLDEVAVAEGAAADEDSGEAAKPGTPTGADGPPPKDAGGATGAAGSGETGGKPRAFGSGATQITMDPLVVTARPPTGSAPGTAPANGPAPSESATPAGGTAPGGAGNADTGLVFEPLVITGRPPVNGTPALTGGAPAPADGATPAGDRAAGTTDANGVVTMEPLQVTGRRAATGASATGVDSAPPGGTAPDGGPAATGPNGIIEMPPMVVTPTPPAGGTPPTESGPNGNAAPNGATVPSGTGAPNGATVPNGAVVTEPMVVTATPPTPASGPAADAYPAPGAGPAPARSATPPQPSSPPAPQPGVIELDPIVITGHPFDDAGRAGGGRAIGPRPGVASPGGAPAAEQGTTAAFPNGSAVRSFPDGSSTRTNPDGSATQTSPNGTSTQTSPDGTVTETALDGSVTYRWPDGSVKRTFPDGSSTMTRPDGSSSHTGPDGVTTPAAGSGPNGAQPTATPNLTDAGAPAAARGAAPGPTRPGSAPASTASWGGTSAAGGTGASGPAVGAVSTGFKEKPKPPLRGGTGKPPTAGAPRARAGGGGAKHAGGGGGGAAGHEAPKPVSLGDAALESWRSNSQAAVAATKPGDIGEAKDGPQQVEQQGKDLDATAKANQPDFGAQAKATTPPMPKEPPKEQTLDTGPADAAIETLKQAGSKRLKDQTFEPIGSPPPNKDITGADFVPKNLLTAISSLEAELAKKDLKPGDRELMTKELEKRKAQVASIEKTGGTGTPPPSPTVTDKGPASLEPPNPAQGEILGDAIARALQQVDSKSTEIVKRAVASLKGEQVPALMSMATDMEATVRQELDRELRGIADAAGVTEKQLATKIEQQKQAVKDEAAAVEAGLAASTATAVKETAERKKDTDAKVQGGKEDAKADAAAKEAALQGPPDTAAIERKRDEYITKVRDVGAQALAGYTSSLHKRESDLDQGGATEKGAIRQAADNQAAAIRRHWANDTNKDKADLEALPTVDWGRSRSTQVDAEVRKLKKAAQTEKEGFDADVATTITTATDKVRDWAAHQEGKERSWWDRLMDMINDWRSQSEANVTAWEHQRNAESRDAMSADLSTLTALSEARRTGNKEAEAREAARLDKDQQVLAKLYFQGGISSIEFVAQSTMTRIGNRRAPELATKMEEKAIADWDWMPLGQLAKARNPGFNPSALANKVRGAIAGWGTNEAQVYAGLGGARTNVERAALRKAYVALFHVEMEDDVKGDMEGHERERAFALMSGDQTAADAATIKEAVEGMGTDEQAIKDALRGKTPEELDAIKAFYFEKYHVELKTDLSDDMEDAELDNALALADGDVDKADAAELEDAMAGPGTDEAKLKKVYERIREEEEARARKEGLSPAELKQHILDRNARVKAKYGEKYGDLDKNLEDELMDGAKRPDPKAGEEQDGDLAVLDALQTGDPSKIAAAKAYEEHKSNYTSDDAIEKVVRDQRRDAELTVALEMKSARQKLDALRASGDISRDDYEKQSRELDAAAKDKAGIEKKTQEKAEQNIAGLKREYSAVTDKRQTFDNLVKYETSGESTNEISELVTHGGKLEDAQELYYAVEGAGTDEDKIKEVLKGKTPKQIEQIKLRYAELHKGRTLEDDVLGDLSGREDLDVGHTLKYGDPDTFAQQLDEEKDPEKRKKLLEGMKQMLKERRDFEETGTIGQIFALGADPMNSADQLEEAVKRADLYNTALTGFEEKNKGKKPEEIEPDPLLTAARANFEMTYGGTLEAQEQVRAQIDAYADAIAQVGAAVAGIVVTVATFGAAGPVVAALYGAAAAAAMTMALKAQLRGAAYSWEEAGVDLAVGAVDAAASAATAGASKAISGALAKAAAAQAAKVAAKEGAEKASESVIKAYLKEAMKEAVENAIQAIPSAAAQAMLDDNTWKGEDPWGSIGMATLKGAGTGAAVAIGMKGVKDLGGAGIKGIKAIKGKLEGKAPGVDVSVKGGTGERMKAGDVGGGSKVGSEPGEVKLGGDSEVGAPKSDAAGGAKETADVEPKSGSDIPEKPTDLPQAADPDIAAKAAEDGKLPDGASAPDPAKSHMDTPDAKAEHGGGKVDTPQGKVDSSTGKVEGAGADAAPPRKPSVDDVGRSLSVEDLKNRYGMPESNVNKIKAVAEQHGVIIDIRPTTPHAEPMLREGTALPKPEKLKAKTINEVDVQIGLGKTEDLGKVGFFEPKEGGVPKRPDNFEALPEKQQKAIDDRIKQRREEFNDFKQDMQKLVKDKMITIEPDGTVLNQGLSKGEKGLPFTGDHDVFDIRAKDGRALPPDKYQAVKQALKDADAGVMHGGVTGWELDSPGTFFTEAGQKSYGKMVADHSPGGKEPLVRIGDGDPKAVWYEPAKPYTGELIPRTSYPHVGSKPGEGEKGAGPGGAGEDGYAPPPGVADGGGYDLDLAKLREEDEAGAR